MSLTHGVQLIGLLHLLSSMAILGMVSHLEEDFMPGGMIRSGGKIADIQDAEGVNVKSILLGAVALVGIPFAITGAVASLYRAEVSLRAYLYFMFTSLVVGLLFNTCWTLICSPVILYSSYVVWSLCEDIADAHFPKLCETSDAIKYAYSPEVNRSKDGQWQSGGIMAPSAAMPVPIVPVVPPTRMMWMNNESWRHGTPQSFIPQPVSGFLPAGPSYMP